MAIVEVVFERTKNNSEEALTVTGSGLAFSATFIKNNKLEQKQSIKFYQDSDNPFWLGFDFFDEKILPNALALQSAATTGKPKFTRTLKATKLFTNSKILQSIRNNPNKASKVFEIKKDKVNGKFYITLRPTFERSIGFAERNKIDSEAQGIYRYLDENNKVIYIGKGFIKDRANSAERMSWQIKTIEFSPLRTEEECFKWEAFYINEHQSQYGAIPVFNGIKGHDVD